MSEKLTRQTHTLKLPKYEYVDDMSEKDNRKVIILKKNSLLLKEIKSLTTSNMVIVLDFIIKELKKRVKYGI